jgi:hypothetical protein
MKEVRRGSPPDANDTTASRATAREKTTPTRRSGYAAIKPRRRAAENPSMTRRCFPLLALCACLASFTTTARAEIPRGTDEFTLGVTREQIDSTLSRRGVEVLSRGYDFLTCRGPTADIAFESYYFLVGPHGSSQLWRVTIAYETPYAAQQLDGKETELRRDLGEPSQETTAPERRFDDNPQRVVIWVDPLTQVQLGGRVRGADDEADRMLVTWTDRKILKQVEAKRRKERKGDH